MRFIDDIIKEWGENVINKIKENLDSTGTTASGKTKDSLELVMTENGFQIVGRQYFRSVEEGRPAGKIPYTKENPRLFADILYQWMKDKKIESQFGSTESEQRSAAYLIGQYIKNNGTKLYRQGGREDIYTDVITEELPVLFDEIEGRVLETIIEELK